MVCAQNMDRINSTKWRNKKINVETLMSNLQTQLTNLQNQVNDKNVINNRIKCRYNNNINKPYQ